VAEDIGAVNTVVNRGGKLYGYNTDIYGLTALIRKTGVEVAGKKVLITGTGGTSRTAVKAVSLLGAKEFYRVGRNGTDGALTYDEALSEHADAQVIINCTPLGMFPDLIGQTPLDIDRFENLEGVIDAVYNPLRSALVLKAQAKGIKASGGLYMLVMQAVEAVRHFTGEDITPQDCERAYRNVLLSKQNTVLIGMPACGKTTVGKLLAQKTGREFIDTDDLIEQSEGRKISEIFARDGEEYFRNKETEIIKSLINKTGAVIATGGGSVLRRENVDALKANGRLYFLDRPLESLVPTQSRPLSSDRESMERKYRERYPVYTSVADVHLKTGDIAEETVRKITEDS
jgi:shikimate dehydrogenase